MLRKKFAILFILLAQVVILGHGMVAHHHHLLTVSKELDHDHGHDHTDGKAHDNGKGFFDIVFSGFIHSGEQVTYTQFQKNEVSFVKDIPQPAANGICEFKIPLEYIISYQQRTFPPGSVPLYSSFHLPSHCLRGPPVFIVA